MNSFHPIKKDKKVIWQAKQWPHFTATNPKVREVLLRARKKQGEVIGKATAIGLKGVEELVQAIYVQEVMATSAIEGQPLNPESVRSSVLRKLGINTETEGGMQSKDVDGLVDVIQDALENFSSPLTAERLFEWHGAQFPRRLRNSRKIIVAAYRDHEDPMQIVSARLGKEVVHYTAPPSIQVEKEMQYFLRWFSDTTPSINEMAGTSVLLDGIERAAIAHLWFESIHPFEDGNGRIGRAIVEMEMAQDAQSAVKLLSLSNQMMVNRDSYYDALNAAQHRNMDVSEWIIWFADIYALACQTSCEFMDAAIEKSHFWNKYSGVQLNQRQRKLIQRLLDDGDGGFLGGLNAEKYIKITGTSKATATRDLGNLLNLEMLFGVGQGKALRYYVNMPSWSHGVR